jgi:hypothetical protein
MVLNTTNVRLSSSIDVSIVYIFFVLSVLISFLLSFFIIISIIFTKTFLSPINILIYNTCITTFFYLIMSILKISAFYNGFVLSDSWCQIQAYLSYVCLDLMMYSYVIQAISRLFFTIFYKYRYLLNYKCHVMLIICQIIISFLIPLSSIITNDIQFRPLRMCLSPMKYLFQIFYLHTFLFVIPFSVVFIIYIVIIRRAVRSSLNVHQSWRPIRRDVELLRNILIIYTIFLFSELPSVIYLILSMRKVQTSAAFYMFAAAAPPISTTFEKISVIILNKETRKEINNRWRRLCYILQLNSNRIQPLTS